MQHLQLSGQCGRLKFKRRLNVVQLKLGCFATMEVYMQSTFVDITSPTAYK